MKFRSRVVALGVVLAALIFQPARAEPAATVPASPSKSAAAPTETSAIDPAPGAANAGGAPHEAIAPEPAADGPDSAPALPDNQDDVAPPESPSTTTAPSAPLDPVGAAVRATLAALPTDGTDEDRKERAALVTFYDGRADAPVWTTSQGPTDRALAVMAEIKNAAAWGLDPNELALPDFTPATSDLAPDAQAAAEIKLFLAVLKYARHARGGRIIHPAALLNSNLDRRPQLLDPSAVVEGIVAAPDPDAYLRGVHPQHVQFQRLRQRYLALGGGQKESVKLAPGPDLAPGLTHPQVAVLRRRLGVRSTSPTATAADDQVYDDRLKAAVIAFQEERKLAPADGVVNAPTRAALNKADAVEAKKLLANMEWWRWMWADLGDLYVFANIPEFMLRVVKNGEVVHTERIVAGETGKQTSIFSRRLKHIVLRPKWKVPNSIKVREIWPSLLRGGNMVRKYNLKLETKDGQPLDFHGIDWRKADIREYEVVQPPGGINALGVVKFSFPSPHTIYMHDTPDKWMFNAAQRTLTHGCLRVRNPVKLAEILLAEDKGWDRPMLDDLIKNGPVNNEVAIERKIPIHLAYFTAWVTDDGALKTYRDFYGHEQRVRLALEGKWDKIAKGADHLAPVELSSAPRPRVARAKPKDDSFGSFFNSIFGAGP